MLELLNRQINLEVFSSNQYRQMSTWCEQKGLTNCATFLLGQAEEELDHMRKLWSFVNETGGMAEMGALDAPLTSFESAAEVFESAMAHEKKVTRSINEMVAHAFSEQDFATFNFLQWFVSEQVEEEALFQTILDRMGLIGSGGRGLYFFDQEIAQIQAQVQAAAPADAAE
jgi:ferritin